MKLLRGTVVASAVASALAILAACSEETPTAPPVVATPPPVTIVPTPTPTPTPTPVAQCTLDDMPDCGANCCSEADSGRYDEELRVAMDAVFKAKPELFDEDGTLAVNPSVYTDAVAAKIRELYGYCARGGDRPGPPVGHSISEDEVAIKVDNRFSQNTDIVIGVQGNAPGIVRHFNCRPAAF